MKVLWTETAVAHLIAIHEYIAKTSPVYAQLTVRRLWDRAGQLEQFPDSGRTVPESSHADLRELLEHPYRILYEHLADRVRILAIVHGRRGPGAIAEVESGRAT